MTDTTITINPGDRVIVVTAGTVPPVIPPVVPPVVPPVTPPVTGGSYRGELFFDGVRIEAAGVDGGYVYWKIKIPLDARPGAQAEIYAYSFNGLDQSRTLILTKQAGDFSVSAPQKAQSSGAHVYLIIGQGSGNNVPVEPGSVWWVSVKKTTATGNLDHFAIRVSALS